mgnify:CR=1 FL=1
MALLRTWLIITAAMLLMWQSSSFASEQITIIIGSWAFEQKSAKNLDVELFLTEHGVGIQATADNVTLAEPIGQLNKVSLTCTQFQLLSERYSCKQGTVAFLHAELGSQKLKFSIKAKPQTNNYDVKVNGLRLAEADISFTAKLANNNWHVLLNIPQASLIQIVSFVSPFLPIDKIDLLKDWSYGSDLNIDAELQGRETQLEKATIKLIASELNVSDIEGKYVTEASSLNIELDVTKSNHSWQWQADVNIPSGQAYGEPVFLDFSETPLSLNASGIWHQDLNHIVVKQATIIHVDIAELNAQFTSDFKQFNDLDLTIKKTEINNLYPIWIQPFLVDTAVANLELAGQIGLNFQLQDDGYQIEMELSDVFIDDEEGRFGLYDLKGSLGWTTLHEALPSDLTWQGGYVYAIPIGKSKIVAEAKESQFKLQQTWTLPILDGDLQLNEFSLYRPENGETQWSFDGLLTPISMESLSSVLEWPTLHGKLSGVIPKVSYQNQHIQVEGALLVKLFGGTTIVKNLQLDTPFGALPQLYANVDIKNLDLETLTRTFDFGKITGKLDGQLNQLRLSNWQPVAFDARFYTPEGDKSKRRISQKAVENLSQIGGGAGGILSRSFLRFFEDFSYQRLGLSCKLANDVCEMTGVSEAEQGYYIVKGGGLPPRINVVGYTRRVGWTDLIERLKSVSQSSGPVIQ